MRRNKEKLFFSQERNQTEDLFLLSWQEVTGECIETVASATEITIVLKTATKTFRLHLPHFEEKFQNLAGKQIGILKTDIQEHAYAVRTVTPRVKGSCAQ